MSLADATFVLVDLETSGLDLATLEIVEVGALRCDGALWPDATFKTLVHNTKPLSDEVRAVHHLSDRDTANAPKAHEVAAELARFIPPGAIVVAHYMAFDGAILQRIMPAALAGRPLLCTKRLTMHVDPEAPSFRLQSLRYRYGHDRIDTGGEEAHRSMADVLVLREVLGSLLWRTGLDRDAEDFMERLVALADSPIWVEYFKFGKYGPANIPPSGARISEFSDVGYLRWCLGNMTTLDADTRATLATRLAIIECLSFGQLEEIARENAASPAVLAQCRQRWREIAALQKSYSSQVSASA